MVWQGERYTGPDFQLDFFGKKIHWRAIMKEKGLEPDEYMPYKKALDFIRENYPIEPYPYTKMSQDIYDQVAEELGFDPDPAEESEFQELKERLQFYDALGTPFDTFHGVDGFFVFIDDQGQEQICTFDATINPEKGEEDIKADIWVGEAPNYKADPKSYEQWYKSIARKSAAILGKGEKGTEVRPATEERPVPPA